MANANFSGRLTQLLKDNGVALATELKGDLAAAEAEASASLARIAAMTGQSGYNEGLIAERDVVALAYAKAAVDRADALDARFLALIQGALHIGVLALG